MDPALRARARGLQLRGNLDEARVLLEQLEGAAEGAALASVLHDKGLLLRHLGRLPEARVALQRALELRQELLPADDMLTASTQSILSLVLQREGDAEAAERLQLASLATVRTHLVARHPVHEHLLEELQHAEPSALHHVDSTLLADEQQQQQQQQQSPPQRRLSVDTGASVLDPVSGESPSHSALDTPHGGEGVANDVFGRPGVRAIEDSASLTERVRQLHLRLMHGFPEAHAEVSRLARDVDMMPAGELRDMATTMCSMLGDMKSLHALSRQEDEPKSIKLPLLEGYLVKNSQSMFKGRVRRWFRVDPRAGELCYYKDRARYKAGSPPRGRMPLMDIVEVRHSSDRGNRGRCKFELTVMKPDGRGATGGFELQAESVEDMTRWIDTLNAYRDVYTTACGSPLASS